MASRCAFAPTHLRTPPAPPHPAHHHTPQPHCLPPRSLPPAGHGRRAWWPYRHADLGGSCRHGRTLPGIHTRTARFGSRLLLYRARMAFQAVGRGAPPAAARACTAGGAILLPPTLLFSYLTMPPTLCPSSRSPLPATAPASAAYPICW